MNDKVIECPDGLKRWTADEVAECLPYQKHLSDKDSYDLYTELWNFLSESKNSTPLGGDGSNGTVETPSERRNKDNDDKALHWWGKLSNVKQAALVEAYKEA